MSDETWVLDATPLIYLATIDRLDLVMDPDGTAVTTQRVYREVVVDGIEAGYADARRIEQLSEREELTIETVADSSPFERLTESSGLSSADASVLALAATRDATAIIDERAGRAVADVEGIDHHGTAYLLLRGVADGRLDEEEATATLDALLDAGWYCAPDLYAKLRQRIETLA